MAHGTVVSQPAPIRMGMRTHARAATAVVVSAAGAVLAITPGPPIVLRVLLGLVAVFGSYIVFDFAMCARRWAVRGDLVDVPTMFDEQRVITQSPDGTTEIQLHRTGHGNVLRVSEIVEGGRASSYDVPINRIVSRADVVRWFDEMHS